MDCLPIVLTTQEVAALFRVRAGTVRAWRMAGRLPGVRVGKELRFRLRDVEEILGVTLDVAALAVPQGAAA
jgi:excisionase family DNA binding protein